MLTFLWNFFRELFANPGQFMMDDVHLDGFHGENGVNYLPGGVL
jgi:hypothetical protein